MQKVIRGHVTIMSRSISGATGFIQSYNYAGGLHLANQVEFGIWMHLFFLANQIVLVVFDFWSHLVFVCI